VRYCLFLQVLYWWALLLRLLRHNITGIAGIAIIIVIAGRT